MNRTKVILCISLCLFTSTFFAQNQSWNMYEVGHYDPVTEDYNDVWGVALNGKEYAIFGSVNNIFIVDVTDCTNPISVGSFNPPGSSSIWRDFKTYNGYVFAVCDNCVEGLVVIDLNVLNNPPPNNTLSIDYQSTSFFSRAHNIYIEGDYLYAVGTNTVSEGIVILDITNPVAPTLVENVNLDHQKNNGNNTATNYYVHDINVSNDIAYCSHGNWQEFAAWDVSDPNNVSFIASVNTGNYCHSSWNAGSGNTAYVCEEVPGGMPIQVIQMSNLTGSNPSMTFLSSFQDPIETVNSGCTANRPHNPFVKGDTLFVSYYHDGLHVYDISSETAPVHIGYYDTYNNNDGTSCPYNGYAGAWGVYPYLPSGCILISDDTYGLRIVRYGGVTCPNDYDGPNMLTGNQSMDDDFETDGKIQSIQTIDNNSIVQYDSKTEIELLPGFETIIGVDFHIYIDGCGNLIQATPGSK